MRLVHFGKLTVTKLLYRSEKGIPIESVVIVVQCWFSNRYRFLAI